MRWFLIAVVLLAAGSLAPARMANAQPEPDPSPTAYDEFRALFSAGRFAEALPYAERMVAEADPEAVGGQDLPAALHDLGATQLRLGDFSAAEASYMRSLELLERSQGISSVRLLVPLAGLAAVYAGQNRHELAIDFYRQALTVYRRAQGLFSPDQTSLVEALAANCQAIGDYPCAEAEHRYLVQIAAQNYGEGDPRVVRALSQLAQWYESMHNYETARLVYAHILEIADMEGGENNPTTIDALLGIGRTHRLQFVADPESVTKPYATINQVSQIPLPGLLHPKERDFNTKKMDRKGYKALTRALDILEDQEDPPPELLGRTLIELGDWYLSARQPDTAIKYYSRASTVFAAHLKDGEAHPLLAPRLVAYRPPNAAVNNRLLPRARVIARQARFTLAVTEKGETQDVVLGSSDMTSMQAFQLQRALEEARYSPRFESGRPIATSGVEFTGQWFDLAPPKAPDPESPPAGSG